ncbi:hypothetical protein J5N97_021603 [Dioscorea zingiberensis]|uniref:EF-hand domain-containing protein n=1 Tax=Dioscorea zingiberensis TaxID=325984 RepID=A0A9D5C8N3_9LILI|nr:hypothetical protein J5N97_021603 [Dioscorea zingiberensis]
MEKPVTLAKVKPRVPAVRWSSPRRPRKEVVMDVLMNQVEFIGINDSNGDGKISPLELREVLENLGYEKSTAREEAAGMVKEMDRDGDGFIDLEEFMKVVFAGEDDYKGMKEELMQAFMVFDVDKNGFITAKELRRVLVGLGHGKCSDEECRAMIRAVDKNGDGLVDFNEFQSMMTMNSIRRSTSSNYDPFSQT